MQAQVVKRLIELNREFYAAFARDFSETRSSERMNLAPIMPYLSNGDKLFEAGCGNGRLAERLDREEYRLTYVGVDVTPELVQAAVDRLSQLRHVTAEFHIADITTPDWAAPFRKLAPFDLALMLAVLHHVPSFERRQKVLCDLAELLRPGGKIIMSNWQFTHDERLRKKVVPWSALAALAIQESELEPGDALLDWKRGGTGYRYVHLMTEAEVQNLATASGLVLAAQFLADADLNLFSVLEKA